MYAHSLLGQTHQHAVCFMVSFEIIPDSCEDLLDLHVHYNFYIILKQIVSTIFTNLYFATGYFSTIDHESLISLHSPFFF